jgi:hypothetical protein
VQVAVRESPVPLTIDAEQPLIDAAPSLKFTVPVGAVPATVAVNVTLTPTSDGLPELASVVVVAVVGDEFTVCDTAKLLDAVFAVSPEYVAMML